MKNNSVTIIDYGVGNLLSVARALEYCGAKVFISRKKKQITSSSKIILPGVGAFGEAVKKLKKYDLFNVIKEISNSGTPILGICVGMQLLMDQSEEFGLNKGLSLIPGKVISVPKNLCWFRKNPLIMEYLQLASSMMMTWMMKLEQIVKDDQCLFLLFLMIFLCHCYLLAFVV